MDEKVIKGQNFRRALTFRQTVIRKYVCAQVGSSWLMRPNARKQVAAAGLSGRLAWLMNCLFGLFRSIDGRWNRGARGQLATTFWQKKEEKPVPLNLGKTDQGNYK